ncbi:MAG TPA: biotin--[acetyl-CoA-carboxylase] ligase [Anaerolineae bacterium]|nr:biotin--[acetyl-CoA-carboxylase] ligase [Anaerolineae bacterium]
MPRSDLEQVEERLNTKWLGHPCCYRPTVDSTMDVARQLAEEGACEGTIVIADEQTAGKGRLQRRWWAPRDTSLLLTLVLRPRLVPRQAQRLTMVCSLAVCDAIEAVAGLTSQVKWPNDVLIGARKVCGILTELGLSDQRLDYALVGVGINVNVDFATAPPFMAPATSLMAQVGHPVSRPEVLDAMLTSLEGRYEALQAGQSFHDEWARRLATIGQEVIATAGTERWQGTALGVDQDGALLIGLQDGAVRRILAGDVTLRGKGERSMPGPAKQVGP